MPETLVLPQWDIPPYKAADNGTDPSDDVLTNHWNGKLRADRVYKLTHRPSAVSPEVDTYVVIGDVTSKDGTDTDMVIVPKIVFTQSNESFRLPAEDGSDNIPVTHLVYAEEYYVVWKNTKKLRRSISEDPFKFTFLNTKTGKPYTIRIDEDFFVCVATRTSKNKSAPQFGRIVDMAEDGRTIKLLSLVANHGIYYTKMMTIKVDTICGIFNYSLHLIDQAEKQEKDKKKAGATAPAAPAEEDQPEAPTEEPIEDTASDDSLSTSDEIPQAPAPVNQEEVDLTDTTE